MKRSAPRYWQGLDLFHLWKEFILNRDIWEQQAELCHTNMYPKLPCPFCNQLDTLELDQDSLVFRSHGKRSLTEIEAMRKKHPYSEANNFWGFLLGIATAFVEMNKELTKFSGFFSCTACEKTVAVAGTGTKIVPLKDEETSNPEMHEIKVEYFSPPVPIFEFSSYLPNSVKAELLQAFNHYHSDLTSSGIKVRKALELLCKELGYEAKNLYIYTELFDAEFPQYQNLLSSMRLLGNEAAHGDSIEREDLLDAFEIFSHIQNAFRDRATRCSVLDTAERLSNKYRTK